LTKVLSYIKQCNQSSIEEVLLAVSPSTIFPTIVWQVICACKSQ